MSAVQKESLNDLLRATSRSFYLTLRVLPAAVRLQIGLAYLLARTTDTIADTEILPVGERLAALQKLRERILGQSSAPLDFNDLARQQASPAEAVLLEKVEVSLAARQSFSAADQKLIRDVLDTITSGQVLDLRRFGSLGPVEPSATGQKIIALETGVSWTITCIALPVVWANFGRRFAGRTCFPVRDWMKNSSSRMESASARACNW